MARASTPVLQRLLRCRPLRLVAVQQGGDKVTGLVCSEREVIEKRRLGSDSLMASDGGSSVPRPSRRRPTVQRDAVVAFSIKWQSGAWAHRAGGGRRRAMG